MRHSHFVPGKCRLPGFSSLKLSSLALLSGAFALAASAAVTPYSPDVNTAYLFHFDESSGDSIATNSVSMPGGNLISFDGNNFAGDGASQPAVTTVLGSAGFIGFGNAVSVNANDLGLGLDVNGDSSFQLDDGSPASADRLPTHSFFGPNNEFTLEALINVPSITSGNRQIISTDHGGPNNSDRGIQFRITSTGQLEFNFIGVSTTSITVPIPTTGDHAFVANEWFHVALGYDGANASFYWTRLDSGATAANLIGGPLAEAVDANDAGLLVIGNEGRAVGSTGATEGLLGLIDEVRISRTARATNEFIFRSVLVEASSTELGTTNYPANTFDGNLSSRWSSQGDGEWITYDLGRYELVESVDIGFYQGNSRLAWFDVLLSNDNLNWRTVLTNAVSSGTTLALQNFNFSDWPARYVRIVGHGNSVNNFNSFTEVAIHSSTPTDVDADGLPDGWENFYFTNLNANVSGDLDADSLSNGYEFLHGTDPTQPNSLGDSDDDGLPDTWELSQFGNLNQTATGDPDRDGFSNLVENQNGTNPNNPNSVIGDADGDSLPDAWENANLGGTNYWAYEDPDGDGYNNVAELVAGTSGTNASSHPAWISPRVAWLRDSIVTNNACLMPNGSTYGRAINGIAFQTDILRTFNGYQYTAWYDTVGTTQTIWLARRTVTNTSVGSWEMVNTSSSFSNGDESAWDAHNVIALGISPVDGTLHFSWDHHGHMLRYRRSVMGLCTTNTAAWGTGGMFNAEQNWLVAAGETVTSVTYPRFVNTPANGLLFTYRTGSTAAGDHWLHNYLPGAGNWSAGWKIEAKEGTYTGVLKNGTTGTSTSRNAYENGYDFGPDGKLHHTWTFREAADAANHDICYAYSTNGGVTWLNTAGAIIADTTLGQAIRVDSPGIIVKPLDGRQRLINQQAQCVDNDGRVHVLALHRRVEPGYEWISSESNNQFSTAKTAYYHYFRDPATGVWSQRQIPPTVYAVGSRPTIGFDAQGNVYGVFLSYPVGSDVVPGYRNGQLIVASASKASQYSDWEIVQALPLDLNGEPRIDQPHLLANNILSVFIQENSATTTVVGTPLHVIDFVVGVVQPNPVALDFLGADGLVTVAGETGYTYQLRKTTSLAAPDWITHGAPVPGTGGLLTLPDPNGRIHSQRFYQVIRNP
jgi:hypothetical protein